MKLTVKQLKQMIKEELDIVLEGPLEDVKPEIWIDVYNGCMGEGVPVLGIEANDEDKCMDLALQVRGGTYDDETVMAHMKYEYGNRNQPKPEKSHHANEMYFDLVKRKQNYKREQEEKWNRKVQIKTEWDRMEPSMKQWKSREYLKKVDAQLQRIRGKIAELRKELRDGWRKDADHLEYQLRKHQEMEWYPRQAKKYFEDYARGTRLSEPLANVTRDWIYKCRYEKEDFYCI